MEPVPAGTPGRLSKRQLDPFAYATKLPSKSIFEVQKSNKNLYAHAGAHLKRVDVSKPAGASSSLHKTRRTVNDPYSSPATKRGDRGSRVSYIPSGTPKINIPHQKLHQHDTQRAASPNGSNPDPEIELYRSP